LICFLFLRVLRWFTSPGLPLPAYEFSRGSPEMTLEGLPHSEIPGSVPVCGSPGLIAACHVLHRFSAPRHPPSTLTSLTIKYLRRESSISTRLLLSKTVITADQKAPRTPGSFLIRAAHRRHHSASARLRQGYGGQSALAPLRGAAAEWWS